MLSPMTVAQHSNYILNYESAIAALKNRPQDRNLQHKAVLSLARSGALDFAIAEYNRFGLNKVRQDEDIMALNGRLSKDLYLRSSGDSAIRHAQDAAQKYEAAFQSTQGYYSGINSATMALMAEMAPQSISDRVAAVEKLLPLPENLSAEDHYFIEATRAECFLLSENRSETIKSLKSAVDFDPLNFSAHATTLKQFKMIARKRSESIDWLTAFHPPKPIHFAGRMRIKLTDNQLENLKVTISDMVQKSDIGFGYGALAAGYDILIAEALLEEGACLNVVLPCPIDRFIEASVRPYGDDWLERFQSCLNSASSIQILSPNVPWPDANINRLTGQMAMGQAILMAQTLGVSPAQVLILGDDGENSYTTKHAIDWTQTGFQRTLLSSDKAMPDSKISTDTMDEFPATLLSSNRSASESFDNVTAAITAANHLRKSNPEAQIALHIDIPGVETDLTLQHILAHSAPQSLLASEVFASLLALTAGDRFDISYAGFIEPNKGLALRCYSFNNS